MKQIERDMLLARLDERTENLCTSMDNHLRHHEELEKTVHERAGCCLFSLGRLICKIWKH